MNSMKNLFDEEVDPSDLIKKKGRKKYTTMQEQFGFKPCFLCKNCKHFERHRYHDKNYFKCALWYKSSSEATDIRANDVACGKYEEAK